MAGIRLRLLQVRAERGLTQRQLAAIAGVRPDTVSALERGESAGIRFDTMAGLCDALNCEPGELFARNSEEHRPPRLGGPDEENIIRERLGEAGPRIDGETFLAALLQTVNREPAAADRRR
jgi:putative transcriptional regulator